LERNIKDLECHLAFVYWALLSGLLIGFGNGLQFMGGQAAGYAAADAVQVSFYFSFRQNVFMGPLNFLNYK
jgi:hypothetical protein